MESSTKKKDINLSEIPHLEVILDESFNIQPGTPISHLSDISRESHIHIDAVRQKITALLPILFEVVKTPTPGAKHFDVEPWQKGYSTRHPSIHEFDFSELIADLKEAQVDVFLHAKDERRKISAALYLRNQGVRHVYAVDASTPYSEK